MDWRAREQAENQAAFTKGAVQDAQGIYRWATNGRIPFDDLLADAGLTVAQRQAHTIARDRENAIFAAEYRKAHANRPISAEQRAEMRAAFGTGTTVVNVMTGRRTKL